jgi:adenylate cyclase
VSRSRERHDSDKPLEASRVGTQPIHLRRSEPATSGGRPALGPLVCELRYRLNEEERVAIVGDRTASIGRAPNCDIVLGEDSVSRKHAEITRNEAGWKIRDLDSKNGVKLNGRRVGEELLRSGDRIAIGAVHMQVALVAEPLESRALVIFEEEPERGTRTEVIDMNRLDSLFASVVEPAPPPDSSVAKSSMRTVRGTGPAPASLMKLVGEAAEALLSCDSLDDTLERILGIVFSNLPAERGAICLYDEQSDRTEPKVTRRRNGDVEEEIVISSNIARDCIERKQALLVQDTKADARFGGADSIINLEIHSAMCAPLYHEGSVVGFVYVDRQTDNRPFEASHLQSLSALALLSAVAVVQASLRDAVRHEQELRSRLARYSSPAVVDRIIQGPAMAGGPGMVAEEGEVTVLFADIIGFTPLTERLGSAEVVRVLNLVFEQLTEAVFEFEGTLDKFRGDGMMAFFGAPIPLADHALRAARAALRMQERMNNLDILDADLPRLQMRIGINSGLVVVGDIGTPERKDYTVIGDVVNTASRLESSVAGPGQVVLGPSTYERVAHGFHCDVLDEAKLKGKRNSVQPYLLLGPR